MSSLIVGMGEVGKALAEILAEEHDIVKMDIGCEYEANFKWDGEHIDMIHVCFPYSDNFIDDVQAYQKAYKPKYTVIHSTVPVGTSRKLNAVHSPIRGIHPNLESGIRTFPKFLGGEQASEIADYFRRAGLKVILVDKPETTEAGKLFDTEYYRTCIVFTQRVAAYCHRNGLNFHEVYTLFNQTYNEGYQELKHGEFTRPVLQPIMTPIGGHCVVPNEGLIRLSEHSCKHEYFYKITDGPDQDDTYERTCKKCGLKDRVSVPNGVDPESNL